MGTRRQYPWFVAALLSGLLLLLPHAARADYTRQTMQIHMTTASEIMGHNIQPGFPSIISISPVPTPGVHIPPVPMFDVTIPSIPLYGININPINIPSVSIPSIGFSSFMSGPIQIENGHLSLPNYYVETILGSNVDPRMLAALRFDDLYIANPDMKAEAKDSGQMARKELARFGLQGPPRSELESQLYPTWAEKQKSPRETASRLIRFPVTLYSVDRVTPLG